MILDKYNYKPQNKKKSQFQNKLTQLKIAKAYFRFCTAYLKRIRVFIALRTAHQMLDFF